MNIAAFDLELAEPMDGEAGYQGQAIACLSITLAGDNLTQPTTILQFSHPKMCERACIEAVLTLQDLEQRGYTIVTWNGASFDFQALSSQGADCTDIALSHVDIMFTVLAIKGFPVGLQKACEGMGLHGKTHTVYLKDGSRLDAMDGSLAPKLWQDGELDAVLAYQRGDTEQLAALALQIEKEGVFRWVTRKGAVRTIPDFKLMSVAESLELPLPDTSWMDKPWDRDAMLAWTKKYHQGD